MNIVVTERDKKLLRLVACLAIIVIFGHAPHPSCDGKTRNAAERV